MSDALSPLQAAIDGARRLDDHDAYLEAVLELDTVLLSAGCAATMMRSRCCRTAWPRPTRRTIAFAACSMAGWRERCCWPAIWGCGRAQSGAARLARKLGNRSLLLDVLVNDFLMPASARPATLMARWRERVDELRALAESIGDDALGRAISIDVYVSAEMGDRGADGCGSGAAGWLQRGTPAHARPMDRHARLCHAGDHGRRLSSLRSDHAERGWDLGHRTHGSQFEGVYGIQMFAIRREQGRLAEVAPVIKRLLDADPTQPAWKPGFALIASDLGFRQPAQRLLDELAASGFVFPLDAKHSMTLAYLAEVCVALEDRVTPSGSTICCCPIGI